MAGITKPLHKHLSRLGAGRRTQRTPALGERELAVLHALWLAQEPENRRPDAADGALSAQQVLERMPGKPLALSTIQSTLERLCRKSLVDRRKQARAYLYRPLLERQELISSLLHDISQEVAGGDIASMVSGFMDYLQDSKRHD
ncbi:BlaI/MecI/CopY family transcriptional regulator [Parahaliea mediterranea]|uniref:BlaI/MecI/CopY family transcriptional regulator n=1 Tax=Parahaliea mediterranea TaxID=651086 RepID=A0A939DI75_9GAMM|nr:BlaI/MecI/CopY family transcriptional regulator [Parahaliea mediterranea]MBN7798739.1 BlaI/MecI/CopY family transcriptional regulator [Parahaliea mediterranea]